MIKNPIRLLLVEGNVDDVRMVEEWLAEVKSPAIEVMGVERLAQALAHLGKERFDVVLCNLALPDSQGLDTFRKLHEAHPKIPVLVLTDFEDEELGSQAIREGVQDFLVKDKINSGTLARTIRHAIERKGLEQRLIASEMSYRRLFESAHDGILILDADTGKITDANPYLEKLLGYTYTEFIGKRLWEIGPFRDKAASQVAFRILQEKGHIRYDDLPLMTIDGNRADVEFISNVYVAGDKQVIQCNIRDITERKQAEEQLRKLSQAAEQSPISILITDRSGNIEYVNRRFEQLTGYTREEIQGKNPRFLQSGETSVETYQELWAAILSGNEWQGELLNKKKTGELFWEFASFAPIFNESGQITHFIAVKEDITERKQIEESLRESESRITSIVNAAMDAIITMDAAQRIILFNPAAEQTFGRLSTEVIGQSIECLMPERFRAAHGEDVRMFGESGVTNRKMGSSGIVKGLRANGEEFSIESSISQIVIAGQKLFTVILRDITERMEAEQALLQAHAELESRVEERTTELQRINEELQSAREIADSANLAKSEFLSRMSHELRTPLNAILGFGQILNQQDLSERSKESVGYILKGGQHLLALINEVLDIARVEAGRLRLSLEPVALTDVVPEVCALIQPLADERHIFLERNISQLENIHVLADHQRLKQVLINLLSNAIKYNREGGRVEISCGVKPEGRITIAVHDTGSGIAPENLPKLFIPFERLEANNSEVEGTGLGLALSQRLLGVMDGALEAESVVGSGSIFTIELPRADVPEAALTKSSVEAGSQEFVAMENTYRVLCIEDNPSNLRLIEVLLDARPNIKLISAIQGSIGLELALRHQPDLILLDLNLPDMHGSEFLHRLQHSAITRDIPVVVVSADATPNQIGRLMKAGAKDYLAKPIDVVEFLRLLDKFLLLNGNSQAKTGKDIV